MTTSVRFGNTVVEMGIVPQMPAAAPPLARAFIAGRCAAGPVNVPTVVRDLTDFEAKFGIGTDTNGGRDLHLAVRQFFKDAPNQSAVILRLYAGVGGYSSEPSSAKVKAIAQSPGSYYDSFEVTYTKTAKGNLNFFYRRMVNGRPSPMRVIRDIPITAAGILEANRILQKSGLSLVYDPTAANEVENVSESEYKLVWAQFKGGKDSGDITAADLAGTLDPETRIRTGLYVLDNSDLGGGVVIAPGLNTNEHRAALLAFAERTGRIAPLEPQGDVYPSDSVTDALSLEGLPGATYGAYYYGRGRTDRTVYGQPISALGHIAALYVNCVMRRRGYVAPPAGVIGLVDIQRGPDGRTPLVDNDNFESLIEQGVNTLILRDGNVEVQGLELLAPDPDQPATTKTYERLILNTLIYDIGPRLRKFDNTYVDARGAFESAVRERITEGVLPYWESNCLYGSRAQDAFNITFGYQRVVTDGGRTKYKVTVNLAVKISPVSEGVTVNLYHLDINAPFNF